jgi:ATP-binding cassette, subfamily A (ABC1), member 3
LGVFLVVASIVLSIIESTRDVNEKLKFIYRLFPSFCLGEALSNLIVRKSATAFGEAKDKWDIEVVGWPCLYMFLEWIVYFLIVLLIEHIYASPYLFEKLNRQPKYDETQLKLNDENMDQDVKAERDRLKAQAPGERDMISIQGLRKVYAGRLGVGTKIAVRDLYFGVPAGTCYGFLGFVTFLI